MAFEEIAVDPDAIRTWRDFQLVWSKMGFAKGRLIACFPDKGPDRDRKDQSWAWRVLESIKRNKLDSGKTPKIRELLIQESKFRLTKRGRRFDHNEPWTSNAAREHREQPFAALILNETAPGNFHCTLDELETEACPACLLHDQHVASLPKQPDKFADALFPMLRHAKELRFVDPYFLKNSDSLEGFRFSSKHASVVREIAKKLHSIHRVPQTVEFHLRDTGCDVEDQLAAFTSQIGKSLPQSWTAKAYLWREQEEGRRFHARYILTDIGGVGSEYGLDKGRNDLDLTDLYLLPETLRIERTMDFSLENDAFKLAAEPRLFRGTF